MPSRLEAPSPRPLCRAAARSLGFSVGLSRSREYAAMTQRTMRQAFLIFAALLCMTWGTIYLYLTKHAIDTRSLKNHHRLHSLEREVGEQFRSELEFIDDVDEVIERRRLQIEQQARRETTKPPFAGPVIPVVVFACNRKSVSRCIERLLKYRPSADQFPIIVSQDCNDEETKKVIESFGSQIIYMAQPDQSDIQVAVREKKFKGYFKIARHYGWALNQTFFTYNYDVAIIVEDDLDIAVDFYEYFLGTYPLLVKDPTLMCVSAWNDNGKNELINLQRPDLLYRTDFFPGLGWMLTKSLWAELAPKWPKSYWDDWIRKPEQRLNRACIRPEISRTVTFGKIGVSNGMFFEKHLKHIKLNEEFVPFTKMNLSYLIKENYNREFLKSVYQSAVVSYDEFIENQIAYDGPVRIPYRTKDAYKMTAKLLGLMDDFRSGVPRTGYRGIVTFHHSGRTVYLAPNMNWQGYDPKWS